MVKFVAISTSVSAVPNPIGGLGIARSTVAIDELGRAWELETNGLRAKWKPLPDIAESEVVELDRGISAIVKSN